MPSSRTGPEQGSHGAQEEGSAKHSGQEPQEVPEGPCAPQGNGSTGPNGNDTIRWGSDRNQGFHQEEHQTQVMVSIVIGSLLLGLEQCHKNIHFYVGNSCVRIVTRR